MPADLPPLLTFAEALGLGEELHDYWQKQVGAAPVSMPRNDFGWADTVQFVLRRASAIARAREDAKEES